MNLTMTEDQDTLVDITRTILLRETSLSRKTHSLEIGSGYDVALWSTLAEAGVWGVGIPSEFGGLGLGFLEACLVLEEIGRSAAAVPALMTLALAPLLSTRATSTLQAQLLPEMAAGRLIVTTAFQEATPHSSIPTSEAHRDGDTWVLTGHKTCVPWGMASNQFLIDARTAEKEVGVFVVSIDTPGITRKPQRNTADGWDASLVLDGTRLPDYCLLGDTPGDASTEVAIRYVQIAACAMLAGVTDTALRLTAEHVKTRKQFGRPLAGFQAVGQRAADAAIASWAIQLSYRQAAWRIAENLGADEEAVMACVTAVQSSQNALGAAQHLHGGVGMDRAYPLHQYYLLGKQLQILLGGATTQLHTLGELMATSSIGSHHG
jgi:3-oxocholest-4-en-26-oyl-CoA dehydrogenase beta subunit